MSDHDCYEEASFRGFTIDGEYVLVNGVCTECGDEIRADFELEKYERQPQ